MKYEAITIKDIAKALGLSTSTVSRALRDSYEIGEDTKKRVQEYAKEFNYRPNPVALSLKERKTRSIGVIVSEIANTFFSQVIDGIESIAYDDGYNVIITQSKESKTREDMIIDFLSSRSVDGLIVSVSGETAESEALKKLHDRGLPIVFIDRILNDIETHKVILNNVKGAHDATVHLINNGYKNISIIASSEHLSITQDRLAGFMQAMEEHQLPVKKNNIHFCEHGGLVDEEVKTVMEKIIQQKNRPDAIFTLSDKLSIEALAFLNSKKIKVPKEIGLIGFSNTHLTSLTAPPMSIVMQPAMHMGEIAVQHLFQLIHSKRAIHEFETTIVNPEIIIRESSKKRN